ncbi:cytochrome oxidase assembly protein ShyY1 [Georgenia soli]|uniref:SURF1-like protein n=1 Tax=Georgenia soli TaxID=638953 RepID=A0A2A9EN46_9MICO|nr:SURF1 family protein [Georgenia soli]PFG40507.1 cytochrome oxidase assembly protein ShyY1 [Georgenia soli]
MDLRPAVEPDPADVAPTRREADPEDAAGQAADRGPEQAPGPHADGTARDYWRAALTPRMIGLFVLLLAAAVVCVRLGAWQLDRASLRGAEKAEAAHAEVLARDVVPVADVLAPQTSFRAEHLGVPVEVTGTYRADQQIYVPGRVVDGQDAVLVVTALWVTQGPDAGAMMPVLRGWLPPEDLTTDPVAGPADAAVAAALAVPEGEVTVTGYLKDSEAGRGSDLPPGMVGAVSSAELANLWGGPTWSGYVVEFTTTPEGRSEVSPTGLHHAPPPGAAEDTGLNIQNLAYAVEWVIFGGFALALWVRMLRDDVRNRREDAGLV